jgi:sulfite exporter TauE/SafE
MRLVGFLMMWIGMSLSLGPINAVLDILPFLGNMSRTMIGVGTFVPALAMSVLTIIISIIAHNVFLLAGLFILIVGGFFLATRLRRPRVAVAAT